MMSNSIVNRAEVKQAPITNPKNITDLRYEDVH